MENRFNKEFAMTKKDEENFESFIKCWICDVKVIDQVKCRGSPHRDCDIKIELNYKILIAFHTLKNYDAHRILLELSIFDY